MPKSVDEVFRDFVRFTGDGKPNEPVGKPLPIGDPSSGVHQPQKKDIREAIAPVFAASELAQAAMLDVQGASLYAASVPSLLANTTASYPAGTVFATREEGVSYKVAPTSATDHDATTAGGVKLYRLRPKRLIFAYSQSNFAGKATGTAWTQKPPENLRVWNGGNWAGDIAPPMGTAFLPAADFAPQVPIAYAAELARSRPEEDWFLVIVARGGTGIRAVAGTRYRFRSATTGNLASGDMRFNAGNTQIAYSETDIQGNVRFLGGASLGTSAFYPARIETTTDNGSRWIEFTPTAGATDAGDYRTQPVTVSGSANWPPPDGTDVTVFPTEPRMRTIIPTILTNAMNALKLSGEARKIDKLLIWPTEADINFPAPYRDVDFPWLMAFLAPYLAASTQVLMTLPWPYGGAGITLPRAEWWAAIRDIVAADPTRRTLVSLDTTGAAHWGDADNVHVLDPSREVIGGLMARSEMTGGVPPVSALSGFYTPAMTAVANVASVTPSEAMWMRIGQVVTVSGVVTVVPTAAGAGTEVRIPLPVPSDLAAAHQLAGVASTGAYADGAAGIQGDATNDAARLIFTSRGVTGALWSYQFSYRVR